MKFNILNRSSIQVDITTPSVLFHRKDETDIECGPYVTELDTGIYYSHYDYGRMFELKLLGFGLSIWWGL